MDWFNAKSFLSETPSICTKIMGPSRLQFSLQPIHWYGGFLSHRATPSSHPIFRGMFYLLNHLAIGYPHDELETPMTSDIKITRSARKIQRFHRLVQRSKAVTRQSAWLGSGCSAWCPGGFVPASSSLNLHQMVMFYTDSMVIGWWFNGDFMLIS